MKQTEYWHIAPIIVRNQKCNEGGYISCPMSVCMTNSM